MRCADWGGWLVLLASAAVAQLHLAELTRRDHGDTFTLIGDTCETSQCTEHGAGNAPKSIAEAPEKGCACVCPQRAPLFREDRELCVDDLPECSLATFGIDNGAQRIPFVFLPLKGQIIHPSKEIMFHDVKTPICAVSGAQFMTRKGFIDVRNTIDADVPFTLFRDEGRTFLQWTGEDDLRKSMSGRLMIVRLLCRDITAPLASALDLRGVFTPCVAFRVQGTPPNLVSNITEVQFAINAQTSASTSSGLSITEYVIIVLCSLLLGSIYVASILLYLHIKKKRKNNADKNPTRKFKGIKKKDGTSITERDIVRITNEKAHVTNSAIVEDSNENEHIVKKNPLYPIGRHYQDNQNVFQDGNGSYSEEDFLNVHARNNEAKYTNQTTSVIVHPHRSDIKLREDHQIEVSHRDESSIERLPDEHVSIVETTDDRDIARPVGTTRRKLYFNPAYFEPHLMAEPPPAALEFLVKIREVIAIAKHKMAAKRFQPILNGIPEEESFSSNGNSLDIYNGHGSQRSGSIISLKRENSRKKSLTCVGCPGCKGDNYNDIHNLINQTVPTCVNCIHNKGDKQNSIRQWLENIPAVNKPQQALYSDLLPHNHNHNLANSLMSLPKGKIKKQNSFIDYNRLDRINGTNSKRASTMSVRSEPSVRNYNLPYSDYDNFDCNHNKYRHYGQTISGGTGIRPFKNPHATGFKRPPITYLTSRNNKLPDMVNEAIALEHCVKKYNHNMSSSEDEKYSKDDNENSNNLHRKKSGSPLGDYETDSLERTTNKRSAPTPTDSNDLSSSQASPSLSNALPLEEELTMRNAIYKTDPNSKTPSPFRDLNRNGLEGKSRHDPINNAPDSGDYSLVSEVYVNNNYNFGSAPTSPSGSECSMGSRKHNKLEEKPGCLTIEVKDCPENYIRVHESDDFEPDTLDRKQMKQKQNTEKKTQFSRKSLVENLTNDDNGSTTFDLKSDGAQNMSSNSSEKFNSLRNLYENGKSSERPQISAEIFSGSKSLDERTSDSWEEIADWTTEEGRILTLEIRHSKRQRQCTPPTVKQIKVFARPDKVLARPDVLPPLPPAVTESIYEQPAYPPRRIEIIPRLEATKNSQDRSLSPRNPNSIDHTNTKSQISEVGLDPMRASVCSFTSDSDLISRSTNSTNSDATNTRSIENGINTNTFVIKKNDGKLKRRKKGCSIEDSGYLSSDSSSKHVQRRLVSKTASCSESDDTENEARSESGAESVETHSVFFGSIRTMQANFDRNKREFKDSKRIKKVYNIK